MIKSLEGSRGVAALIVALYHLQIGMTQFSVIRNGYLFVDLFFVLSGFVICAAYLPRLDTTADFRVFIIRRIGRLMPLLLFSTVAFVLVFDAIVLAKQLALAAGLGSALHNPGALDYLVPNAKEILATITFTQSLGVFDHLILNTPTWSISTEFYTYFLFAGICILAPRRMPVIVYAVLCACSFLVVVWTSVGIHKCMADGGCLSLTYDFGFARCVYSFFLGALTFHFSRHARFNPVVLQIAAVVLITLLFAAVDRNPAIAFAFPTAYSLLVLSLHTDRGPLARLLAAAPFQMLGKRSYSIYLMHMPLLLLFQNLAQRAQHPWTSALVAVAFVAAVLVVSGWTYRHVESPWRITFNRLSTARLVVDSESATGSHG